MSLRSHFRLPQQPESSRERNKQSSRIPTKSNIPGSKKQETRPPPSSKSGKRASVSNASVSDPTKPRSTPSNKPPIAASNVHETNRNPPTIPPTSAAYTTPYEQALSPPPVLRTPSLVSGGSSVSTFDSPRSNTLRRKHSGAIDKYAAQKRAASQPREDGPETSQDGDGAFRERYDGSVLGISLPLATGIDGKGLPLDVNQRFFAGEQDAPDQNFAAPVQHYAPSGTPSTRYTDSPFSHVPTPSTASSYSPTISTTVGTSLAAQRQASPAQTRPPVSGRIATKQDPSRLGLPPVRESSTSSSNSTVRPGGASTSGIPNTVPQRKPSLVFSKSKGTEPSKSSGRNKLTKGPPASTVSKRPVQVPPELAHLNVDVKSRDEQKSPPARPSRDGTPNIGNMNEPSPVVQSDLPRLYTTYHKRTPSQETPVSSTTSPSPKSRFGFSKSPSLNQSPRIDSAVSPSLSTRKFAHRPTRDVPSTDSLGPQRKDTPISSNPGPAKSPRFGLFSRKPKADATQAVEKPKRPPAKGPIAGTGHEGYGRFGIRGRSTSTTSSGGIRSPSSGSSTTSLNRPAASRKSSTGSKDGSELDDFLRERLNPVILRGTGSSSSIASSNPEQSKRGLNTASSSSASLASRTTPQLLPSAMQKSAGTSKAKSQPDRRTPSDSSEESAADFDQGLTMRSLNRLSRDNGQILRRTSHRMREDAEPNSLAPRGARDEITSAPKTGIRYAQNFSEGKEGLWLKSNGSKVSARDQKRNFLERVQASPQAKGKQRADITTPMPDPDPTGTPRGVWAHYTALSPTESVSLEDMNRILQESEASPEDSMSESNARLRPMPHKRQHKSSLPTPQNPRHNNGTHVDAPLVPPRPMAQRLDSTESGEVLDARTALPRQNAHVVNIPRSPKIRQDPSHQLEPANTDLRETILETDSPLIPQIYSTSAEQTHSPNSQWQSRLSPVGRIPRVVSRRDRDRKLPDNSFSRPFIRSQPRPSVKPPGSVYTQIREMASPIESYPSPTADSSTQTEFEFAEQTSEVHNVPAFSRPRAGMGNNGAGEFLMFPPNHISEQSYWEGPRAPSWIGPHGSQYAHQDDIWNEYNDFMDDVMHLRTHASSSSFGAPFQYSYALDPSHTPRFIPSMVGEPPTAELPLPPGVYPSANVLTVAQQVARFLQPSMSPLEEDFTSKVKSGHMASGWNPAFSYGQDGFVNPPYSDRKPSVVSNGPSVRNSAISSRYSRGSSHSRTASLPDVNARSSQISLANSGRFNRDTQLMDIAEIEHQEQASTRKLRLAALMTSKWLSADRVLVSPAHHETQLAEEPRVLVIDGLSNDWSYYVAISYPSAAVYNLSSNATNSTFLEGNQQAPANHRHIPHSSIGAAFPFPKGFFTSVVLRYPKVTTEQAYQACLGECKRVLRPGGFLEVVALDLDLNNMGNKARRAVRGLKTRMQLRDANVCLYNLSDVLVRLIGRRGFEGVQRCVLGVPAAGNLPRSREGSSGSLGDPSRPQRAGDQSASDFQFSLDDLLEHPSQGESANSRNIPTGHDDKSTKIIAKVSRWWYSSCYEKVLVPSDQSIWTDSQLLRECEAQGTTFRLLICHAQKPTQPRRRTVSV